MDKTRFISEWVVDMPDGEFDPANCEYGTNIHGTYKMAELHAKDLASRGPFPGWYRVSEERYDPNYYGLGAGGWETVRIWTEGVEVKI